MEKEKTNFKKSIFPPIYDINHKYKIERRVYIYKLTIELKERWRKII